MSSDIQPLSPEPNAPVPDSTLSVSALLQQSRASHYKKKQSAGRADRAGHVTLPPNYITTEQHVKDALLARLDAELLDADHTDPAWYTDQVENKQVTSAALLKQFVIYLSTDRYSSAWDEVLEALDDDKRRVLSALTQVEIPRA